MVDSIRRKLLKAGTAAAAATAASRVLGAQRAPSPEKQKAGSFYEKGKVRIHYEEAGSGFPLLVIPGGGLNSTIAALANPFNPLVELKNEYRCIASDLRNANGGQSSGPLEIDRPWDAYADDQLGLIDHLGIREFMVLGFCIGAPFIWNLLRRAPGRIVTLASVSGIIGNRGQANYSAAKGGIIAATKALAVELARREITVNCVAPGLIDTDMVGADTPMEKILEVIPMQRIGKPEEVAAVVSFLMSADAAYVTRQVISVNGGLC